jgi:hypothetical protein
MHVCTDFFMFALSEQTAVLSLSVGRLTATLIGRCMHALVLDVDARPNGGPCSITHRGRRQARRSFTRQLRVHAARSSSTYVARF